jgi:hypothetical protein
MKIMRSKRGGYDDLAPRHIHNHPLETRPKFHNRLDVTLDVVKKGHESCERSSDRVRTTVAIEHVNHLEAFAMKTGSSVVKKKTEPPILESNSKLTLPITTGLSIGRVSDEKGIRTMGGVIIRSKVVINFILHVQITLDILDLRKLEGFRTTKSRLVERSERRGGGRRTECRCGGEKMAAGGIGPAEEGHPDRVMSEPEAVERSPRGKERSGETAGAVGDATDVGTWGCPPEGGGI